MCVMGKVPFILLCLYLIVPAYSQNLNLPKFIDKYCSDCHADGMDKGGLDFDKLKYDLKDPASFAVWERVYDRVLSGEMPPKKKKKQPTADASKQHTQGIMFYPVRLLPGVF